MNEDKKSIEDQFHAYLNGVFSSITSSFVHDIRNDLVRISDLSHMLERIYGNRPISEKQVRRIISDLQAFSDHAQQSVDIYRYTIGYKNESAYIRPINIMNLLQEVCGIYSRQASRHRIEFEQSIQHADANVRCDPHFLKIAFFAILQNSIEACAQNKQSRGRRITIAISATPNEVEITITDNGEGMRPDMISRAFDQGVTDKIKNQGFGLYIARKIVEQIGGHIQIESTFGMGTSVKISLPASPKETSL